MPRLSELQALAAELERIADTSSDRRLADAAAEAAMILSTAIAIVRADA